MNTYEVTNGNETNITVKADNIYEALLNATVAITDPVTKWNVSSEYAGQIHTKDDMFMVTLED